VEYQYLRISFRRMTQQPLTGIWRFWADGYSISSTALSASVPADEMHFSYGIATESFIFIQQWFRADVFQFPQQRQALTIIWHYAFSRNS
jgi:hypothetical protein